MFVTNKLKKYWTDFKNSFTMFIDDGTEPFVRESDWHLAGFFFCVCFIGMYIWIRVEISIYLSLVAIKARVDQATGISGTT